MPIYTIGHSTHTVGIFLTLGMAGGGRVTSGYPSNVVVVRGIPVRHVIPGAPAKPHDLSEFARVEGSVVTYPGLV